MSPPSYRSCIGSKPVIICQVKAHELEETSETPSDDPPIEANYHDPLLAMVHDSLNQSEITDSSDIAQLLSINKANTQKDPQLTATIHTSYIYA